MTSKKISEHQKPISIGKANESDDKYIVIEDEFEQIRNALGMYIGSIETEAAMHLLTEILNNAIDELVNPNSKGHRAIVRLNVPTRTITVQDDGRGIPFDRVISSCTKKHSSTKIIRDEPWMKGLAGRNGVGMVIVTALSEYMGIFCRRDGHEMKVEFTDGQMKEPVITKLKKDESGTSIVFMPSEKYLGPIHLTSDIVENYLRNMSYVLLPNTKIDYYVDDTDENGKDTHTFIEYKPVGIKACVEYLSSTLEFEPFVVSVSTPDFDLELAMSYDKTLDGMIMDSFCNYIHTVDGGFHVMSATQAICTFFSREARKLDPNAKYEVTFDDCRKGLIAAVNCRHMDPKYEGQDKTKIDNKDILSVGKGLLVEELAKFFERNNGLLRKIISYLRMIAKARMEVNKIKELPTKKTTTFLDDISIDGFYNVTDRNTTHYTEIYITEGESAGSQLNTIRNRKYQAILALRGPIDNVTGMNYKTMMSKEICRKYIQVLGCGAGPTFDIKKLRWNKIIIMTDADIDGSNLASLVMNLHYRFMPETITSGRLYVGIPPLYKLDLGKSKFKGNNWVYNIKEYYNIVNMVAADMLAVALHDEDNTVHELSKNALVNWLNMNAEYLLELNALNTNVSTSLELLEHVCYAKIEYSNSADIKNYLHQYFPEMDYDLETDTIDGSINGEHYTMIADRIFDINASRFIHVLKKNPCLMVGVRNRTVVNDPYTTMTIGSLLNLIGSKVSVTVKKRYKGLGEANGMTLFVTTMHPKLRRLYRLNINNEAETKEIFDLLHEKTEKMRSNRRDLLRNTMISYNDIDN